MISCARLTSVDMMSLPVRPWRVCSRGCGDLCADVESLPEGT